MADNTFLAPLSPIQRSTPSQRVATFERNESSIYNKFSPYYQATQGIGPSQPFVYTKLTDSSFQKNLTRYDSPAAPIGSTIRDVVRITKFSVSGAGLVYAGKQILLQDQNAFNETRIYNPVSIIKAAARPGVIGAIDRPQRHLETSGGLLNFFRDALFSTIGISTSAANRPIEGTAGGINGDGISYSNYAGIKGGAKYGVMRFNTGNKASTKFNSIWGVGSNNQSGGNRLSRILVDRLRSLIPTTNPLGAYARNQLGRSTSGRAWTFRPEYNNEYQSGIYFTFLEDSSNLMITPANKNAKVFYNDSVFGANSRIDAPQIPKDFHKYTPGRTQTIFGTDDSANYYASNERIQQGNIGTRQIQDTYAKLLDAIQPYNNVSPQFRKSAEGYSNDVNKGINDNTNYRAIPGGEGIRIVDRSTITEGPYLKYLREQGGVVNEIRIDNRLFARAKTQGSDFGTADEYNRYLPDISNENELRLPQNPDQSKDIIFFYFYDLINKVYIPFRATLGSISDQHSPEWEPIKYMGRADTLYVYKGFGRDVNFTFKVYANSVQELVPMWERIDYMTGLTRPSKYTNRAIATAGSSGGTGTDTDTTGLESGFIYPPMIEFRIGDLYVDQPAIIRSLSVSVPEDAHWETLRSDTYKYVYGVNKTLTKDAQSRQLPTIADVTVQLTLLEKEKSITNAYHFGPIDGWNEL